MSNPAFPRQTRACLDRTHDLLRSDLPVRAGSARYNRPHVSRSLPLVVLVGRPNVGKSTLFNRITGTRRSIVTPVPGTTRDVIAQVVQWQRASFTLLDTGGMFGATEDPLQQMVAEKGKEAITRADLLVVVLDGQHGLVPGDLDIVKQLRASGSPILAVVNKIDAKKAREATMQFYELGIDPMFEISAEHGMGISDLLDEIARRIRKGPDGGATATEAGAAPRDQPPRKSPSRSSAVPTPASRRWSTACCARSGCSSARCQAPRGTRSTRC